MNTQTQAFDKIWRDKSSPWKRRFQYNIECARKNFLAALRVTGVTRKDKSILDIGFGGGTMMFQFHPSCRLFGTDFSEVAIQKAKTTATRCGYRFAEFIVPERPDVLPYQNSQFDVVVASHVVEHVENFRTLLSEIVRVLKSSGRAIIIIPLEAQKDGLLNETELRLPPTKDCPPYHVRFFNFETFSRELQPSRILASWQDMAFWDLRMDLERYRPIRPRILDSLLSGVLNVPMALLPLPVTRFIDVGLESIGYRYRQATFVIARN